MKIVAAVPVRNEAARYLEPCVAHLLEFCDEVRILDDGSDDRWQEALRAAWGSSGKRVLSKRAQTRRGEEAFNNHAAARNQLLRFALEGWPDAVLQIDADEFVSDGAEMRRLAERHGKNSWSLVMEEVWEACDDLLCIREDGGWASHPITMLWRPDMARKSGYKIRDLGHATGRTPQGIGGGAVVGECLHFGWASRAERAERFRRYSEGDGGKYHAKAHIESIMWPDSEVACRARPWPPGLAPWREALIARSARVAA